MTTPIQLTIGVTPPHRNQYLFSDHYLDELLLQDPRWSQALPEAETAVSTSPPPDQQLPPESKRAGTFAGSSPSTSVAPLLVRSLLETIEAKLNL